MVPIIIFILILSLPILLPGWKGVERETMRGFDSVREKRRNKEAKKKDLEELRCREAGGSGAKVECISFTPNVPRPVPC